MRYLRDNKWFGRQKNKKKSEIQSSAELGYPNFLSLVGYFMIKLVNFLPDVISEVTDKPRLRLLHVLWYYMIRDL